MFQRKIASATLIAASLCLVVAQQQQTITDDELIRSVFNNAPVATTSNPNGHLGVLIDEVFQDKGKEAIGKNGPNGNGGAGTYLGSHNVNTGTGKNDCDCVPYYQCRNGTILDDGVGLIDIRVSGPCDSYLDVCCKIPNIINPDERVTPPPREEYGCGRRNIDGVGFRITGDEKNEAQFGEFPWVVAVLEAMTIGKDPAKTIQAYVCGGSLIHRQAVLTAAHCVKGKNVGLLKIRAGEWDTQTKNEIYPHQDRNVSSIIIHENFNSGSLVNDFAILLLSSPVDLTENVNTICLPDRDARFDTSRCFASGWGKNVFGKEGTYQVILKKVEVPVVPNQVCQDSLRNTRLGRRFLLNGSFMCAGGEPGKDTCEGDGGSPLVCPLNGINSRYVQAGIVSWGIGCGGTVPGVYANVVSARAWIKEQLAYNNLNPYENQLID